MYKAEREMFRQALSDAFVRKYERELSECRENALCSEAHTRRMEAILRQGAEADRKKHRRRWIAALLAAAALLLAACPVYANHAKIRDFIEKVYEKYILITFSDSSSAPEVKKIAEKYTLGYVPEGYELVKDDCFPDMHEMEWQDAEGNYLLIQQGNLYSSSYVLDSESGESSVIPCGQFTVYYRKSTVHTYIWNNGTYSFLMVSSLPLSTDTLSHIVTSIRIDNESGF